MRLAAVEFLAGLAEEYINYERHKIEKASLSLSGFCRGGQIRTYELGAKRGTRFGSIESPMPARNLAAPLVLIFFSSATTYIRL